VFDRVATVDGTSRSRNSFGGILVGLNKSMEKTPLTTTERALL
jgi:hypothetical protein